MQTQQVIRTIRWLDALMPDRAKELIFNWEITSPARKESEASVRESLGASQDLARFAGAVAADRNALRVLEAFGLKSLSDLKFAESIALSLSVKAERETHALHALLSTVVQPWRGMIKAADAFEDLTIPQTLRPAEPDSSLVSLELRYRESDGVDLQTLSKAAELIEKAYSAIAQVYDADTGGQLKVIKIESGSSVRFDCRGLGDAVKHFKDFVLEAWHKYRHQKAEELTVNNNAVLSSLTVVKEITRRQEAGELSPESAELLRRAIAESTVGLFTKGVLPAEATDAEIVDNVSLLSHFNPKLLTDGSEPPPDIKPVKKKRRKKKPEPVEE